jgi:hypothetical protein
VGDFLGFVDVYRAEVKKERAEFGAFFNRLDLALYSIKSWRDFQIRREV